MTGERASTIVWDFDGTILPLAPYDSEQTLLLHCLKHGSENRRPFRRWFIRAIVYADRREWFKISFRLFKRSYLWAVRGSRCDRLEDVAGHLAASITPSDRNAYRRLAADGHRMVVVSCGTADLSERTLARAGVADCFQSVIGNRFRFACGQIAGMNLDVASPADKLAAVRKLGLVGETTIAVGDGYSDLPLLDWAARPFLIDRDGTKKRRYAGRRYRFVGSVPELAARIGSRD